MSDSEILGIWQILISLFTPWIAWCALRNWKKPSKAQREIEFLDELVDRVHEFIDLMSAPIQMVELIEVAISCHTPIPNIDSPEDSPAIIYIKKQGAEDAKRLQEYLKPCYPVVSKIRSLVVKGQIFGLKNYNNCQNSCKILTWQHDRIQGLCRMIGASPYTNWQNPLVASTLSKVIEIKADDLKKQLEEQSAALLIFAKKNYEHIYGK